MIKLIPESHVYSGGKLIPAAEYTGAAKKSGTIAAGILAAHNSSGSDTRLELRFDAMASHDITYVGIIQTARASGLTEFPLPYVLTNCHNSLCAVGGTINEDDHAFGLSAAQKYGGIYVPPHLAVIHQYMREKMAGCGKMILGSDSHTRYGALGCMAIGEGGGELAKQLLRRPYQVDAPEVCAVWLDGTPRPGVGPQDVALAIIGEVFGCGFVKNRVMEFVGPGIANLTVDYRNGVDVMTTETACLSSVWATDEAVREYLALHGRETDYAPLAPAEGALYDRVIRVDLSKVVPMIALPFHPSNVYTVEDVCKNPGDILRKVELEASEVLEKVNGLDLVSKIRDGKVYVDQGIIAGCAGGSFENLCAAADILEKGSVGNGLFSMSVYPASQPVYAGLLKNGVVSRLVEGGVIVKTAFCGPCFGAGDVPANNAFSIRHSTRNFPNREGSKPGGGQIASVALMDARSVAATAARGGILTPATELAESSAAPVYAFDGGIYDKRVLDRCGKAEPETELLRGPNIADWPTMPALADNLILQVASVIHDPVTTTDELIPSGETSSYRSNPLKLSEFALSRKDPGYVGRAKEIHKTEVARESGETDAVLASLLKAAAEATGLAPTAEDTGIGSLVFAVKPGDGSAREQAASCQRVLGGWANIACEYATKRYRSNLINWGLLPFVLCDPAETDFAVGEAVFLPGIRRAVAEKAEKITAYVLGNAGVRKIDLTLGNLTDDEREIILDGCLINHYSK